MKKIIFLVITLICFSFAFVTVAKATGLEPKDPEHDKCVDNYLRCEVNLDEIIHEDWIKKESILCGYDKMSSLERYNIHKITRWKRRVNGYEVFPIIVTLIKGYGCDACQYRVAIYDPKLSKKEITDRWISKMLGKLYLQISGFDVGMRGLEREEVVEAKDLYKLDLAGAILRRDEEKKKELMFKVRMLEEIINAPINGTLVIQLEED